MNPAVFGQPISLVARVTPAAATGKIVFYDGASMIGIQPLTNGIAAITTSLLPAGVRSLKAYYGGDASHSASTSPVVSQVVNAVPANSWYPAPNFPSVDYMYSVAAADFNGDGNVDLAVSGTSGLNVLLSYGDGTFHPVLNVSSKYLGTVATGDFNGDGKADLAVASLLESSIFILSGNGDGTFQPPSSVVFSSNASSMVVADFNGDGKADLAIATSPGYGQQTSQGVLVLLGKGDGTFQMPFSVAPYASALAAADFDGDGKADLVIMAGTIDVLLGNGDGTFRDTGRPGTAGTPYVIAVGHFNGDGKADIAFDDRNNEAVEVQLGRGDGTFEAAVSYPYGFPANYGASHYPVHLTVGDVNGDGKADLVLDGTASTWMLAGSGNGTFRASQVVSATVRQPVIVDVNGDGRADLAGPDCVLLGRISPASTTTVTASPNPVTYGGTPTLTATVSPAGATGIVTFLDGPNVWGRQSLVGGRASQPIPMPATGTHAMSAIYSGDSSYNASSADVSVPVLALRPQITLTSSPNPSMAGQLVTFTITIQPSTCTGGVSLMDTLQSQAGGFSFFNGTAIDTLIFYRTGSDSVTAVYSGDENCAGATSAPITQVVTQGTSVTTLTSSVNPTRLFQTTVLTASVSNGSGTVTYMDGSTILGTRPVRTPFPIAALPAGSHSLTAVYSGDSSFSPSSSTALIQVVSAAVATSATLTSSANPSTVGRPVTLTAKVSNASATGVVTFYDGATILGMRPVAAGQATLTTSVLPAGVRSLRAYYSGDNAYSLSNSAPVSQTVQATAEYGFQQPVQYSIGTSPSSSAVGDFNGDDIPDIAVSSASKGVSVFIGKGDGTFAAAVNYPIGAANSNYNFPLAVGDFDGDGKADIAVGYSGVQITAYPLVGYIAILRGKGDGTFQATPNTSLAAYPGRIFVADFDGDGIADLAVRQTICTDCLHGREELRILLGLGNGAFRQGTSIGAGFLGFSGLGFADLNGDGKPDIVTGFGDYSPYVPGGFRVNLGNGDGTFWSSFSSSVLEGTFVVADFNGDGKPDLIGSNLIQLGNGDGTFQPPASISSVTYGIGAADFNGDGKLDLAGSASDNLGLYLGNGDGTFQPPLTYASGTPAADFNGDGRIDLMMLDGNNLTIQLAAGLNQLSFGNQPANGTAGTALPAVVVQIQGYNSSIVLPGNATVSLTSSPAGVSVTAPIVNGAATFNNLVLNSPGSYKLMATSAGLNGVNSGSFSISSGNATRLAFTSQPSNGTNGSAIPPVVVQVQDAGGNLIASSGAAITISSTPAAVSATVNAVNGVATFSNLVLNATGSFTLTASASGLASAVSNAFSINSTGNVTVSGQVSASGAAVSGVTVTASGSAMVTAVSNGAGFYSLSLPPHGNYTLRASRVGYRFSTTVSFTDLSSSQTVAFAGTPVAGLEFVPVTPCRLVDTRVSSFQGGFGPPSMSAGETRTFAIPTNSACGIPASAAAYSLNVTVVTKGYLGILSIWPTSQAMPNVSTLNSYSTTSTAVANAAIVPAGTNGAISVYVTDATELIIDINGYFTSSTSGMQFYPVTPCRLVDTRVSSFQAGFGPPFLFAGSTRSFTIPENNACRIPANAGAYSLNVTAVPQKTLGFLSLWPAGRSLPNVSTLNVYTAGTVVANAAIVPAGTNGAISAIVSESSDLVIDIDGYFAPGTDGLKLYPMTPCRVADTRVASMPAGLGTPAMGARTQRSFGVPESPCGVPVNAGAYSLNFTAVPRAPQLGVFATWPTGQSQPDVSTMNSYNGAVVANGAIVPAGSGGAISIYVTDLSDVLFDVNGYFAP